MNKNRAEGLSRETRFVLMFRSPRGEQLARIVIEGLRTFGGRLRDCQVLAFVLDPEHVSQALPAMEQVQRLPLTLQEGCPPYPFAEKVYACARAEELAGPEVRSLVWLSLDALIVNPPLLFDLGQAPDGAPADAAFRAVHHRNIGSPADEPLDAFWQGVYRAVGIDDVPYRVESFVDRQTLRPYFNTHCFSFSPTTGMGQAWWEHFKALVTDETFQAGPCSDALHQLFLHQAVLSALVAQLLDWDRVRLLPRAYNYPLHMLEDIPPDRRAATLNSLVSPVYEDTLPWGEIEIQEPLRSWLMERFPPGG